MDFLIWIPLYFGIVYLITNSIKSKNERKPYYKRRH